MLILNLSVTFLLTAILSQCTSATIQHDNHLPLLNLPYGTWRAHHYDHDVDVYTFRNIRYAAPPVGDLRWSKPTPPEFIPGIQNGSYGHNCIPAPIPGNFENPIFENISKNAAEDCLFLDVYVPGKALKERNSSVPVVVWIHGGGYVTGSKDQAIELGYYDGTSLVQRGDNDLIVVSINYRLGGFGFLAGEPLLSQGDFNAGLHDQRAALEWVQSYIHLLGGDRHNVSAWGQSGGAGSIIYHLIAEGGSRDPLFRRALLQSPAFGVNANPPVYKKRFETFAAAAGCLSKGEDSLRCLRAANSSALAKANGKVFAGEASPVPDGKYIRGPALVEYARGNTWKDMDSIINSHVLDEASLFLPDPIPGGFLQSFISGSLPPNSTAGTKRMVDYYQENYANSSMKEKAAAMYFDLIFSCNMRAVLEAYPDSSWSMQYSFIDGVINGTHGSDAPATWYNSELQGYTEPLFERFQRYLTNHARTADPNVPRSGEYHLEYWPRVSGLGDEVPGNVLNVTNGGFRIIKDSQMSRDVCEIWNEVLLDAVQ
ncbi:uncharacterized protein APUU_21553A [Aspergillus puulaauensis]|uniref:Carboxylesterase type B domain-containing protein n=1 Tax=Aspergillus puulaauensis TaxID=1220207 RepID=A0A7R7XGR1_9EURO|nr:uncharacterized protein APUU_21553A [Aspergillus puulaauensis]BCS21121.1 hypothetical protein APUU_21553A [Aspergillus puulaauensis]